MVPQESTSHADPLNFPFLAPQTIASYSSSQPSSSVPGRPTSSFRAPAHKHAHHLHSIPPREKSTRTLIIDHMLWVHGRTRFGQARAELGMTDRTGGSSSSNYVHRKRPENYEEDDEVASEGEDALVLKARVGDPYNHSSYGEGKGFQAQQDLTLARSLRLRAEGLEKVITAMLGQPPLHPTGEEGLWTPPTSPTMNPSLDSNLHPHTLPNGVRLRLALATIINDLFDRQAHPAPHLHQSVYSKTPSKRSPAEVFLSDPSADNLPLALRSLSSVYVAYSTSYPTGSQLSTSTYSGFTQANHIHRGQQPTARTKALYKAGVSRTDAKSPRSRCPRHLRTGCEICVEARTHTRPIGGNRGRYGSLSSGFRNIATNPWKGMPGGVGPGGGGISGWQDGSGIGSGLSRDEVHGNVLSRKAVDDEEYKGGVSSTGAGNAKLSELIPRFIKLSALVAVELAMEAKDSEEEVDAGFVRSEEKTISRDWSQAQLDQSSGFSPLPPPISSSASRTSSTSRLSSSTVRMQDKWYDAALQPTREWYLLLAGLLTRAVLEGYLTAGWKGVRPVECLLTVGLGMADREGKGEEPLTSFEEFDPEGLPTLLEAIKLLFPSLKSLPPPGKGRSEEEYESEMRERLRKFYDVPASTPDLSTHMEDLAWQYPAEPVERAAERFCEAIAGWRGKPELETYKKSTPTSTYTDDLGTPGNLILPIESLVHSTPPTPTLANSGQPGSERLQRKPSIHMYFTAPPSLIRGGSPRGQMSKRFRLPDDSRPGPAKRIHV